MKKLIILGLLMTAVALIANVPNFTWHVEPTTLSFSMYDYMNGAYDGFAVMVQEEGIENRGMYVTYMANQSAAVPRRQRYAFVTFEGGVEAEDTITSTAASEGFGTLAIDPVSGNPFFVWHANYLGSGNPLMVHMTYDIFSFSYTAGTAMADPTTAIANDPAETAHVYIWPVAHVGPSPEQGKRRVYVFASNSGTAVQGTPSSSITLAFADFDTDDIEMGSPSDLVWTVQRLPYFLDIHNWSPSDPDDNFARAFPSYAVSNDGKVALAGFISGNTTEWSGMEEHDTFVVMSDDYGQTFTATGLNLERHLEDGEKPKAQHNGQTIYPYFGSPNDKFRMTTGTLNHKTITFDDHGRLHFPATFYIGFSGTGDDAENNYWIPVSHSVTTVIYNPADHSHQFYNIWPRPEEPLTSQLPMVYDLDDDGWIDEFVPVQDTDNTWYATQWFRDQWPVFHHNTSNMFHYNQMKMTKVNNGLMAMMWMDGTKAYRYNVDNDEDYAEYATAPQIKLVVSKDNGNNWSLPITLDVITNPELGDVPSYVYPADMVIWDGPDHAIVYFMYVDDLAYGSAIQNEGANVGANIKFAALRVDISDLTNIGDQVANVRPLAMLGQNYPNPFNPTTNIKFNIPSASNVKLSVYNVKGQLVKTLVDNNLPAGEHHVSWNGVDNNNNSVASGVYFYKLEANGQSEMRKMLLMK